MAVIATASEAAASKAARDARIAARAADPTALQGVNDVGSVARAQSLSNGSSNTSSPSYSSDKIFNIGGYQVDLSSVPESQRQATFQSLVNQGGSSSAIVGAGGVINKQMTTNLADMATKNKWVDPTTGINTPAGIGMPEPINKLGTQIADEADLEAKRQELRSLGIAEQDFPKYISQPTATDARLYYKQPTVLVSPTGETRTVAVGSTEANALLKANWTTSSGTNYNQVNGSLLSPVENINIGDNQQSDRILADITIASGAKYSEQQKKIMAEIANTQRPTDSLDVQLQQLLNEQTSLYANAKSLETIKAEEKAKANILAQQQAVSQKADEIDVMLAKSAALDASYQSANQSEEGRPQTLSRLQGAQAQNYKMYLAQHNAIAADTALLVAQGKALEGKLSDAVASANDAINLRYQSQQDTINNRLNMINILIPQIEKKDAEYATAVKNVYDRENDAINERKSWMTTAVNNGIFDAKILSQIDNASGFAEAMELIWNNIPQAPVSYSGGGVSSVNSVTPQTPQIPSFEEYLQQKGDAEGVSYAFPEMMRSEYDNFVKEQTEQQEAQGTDVIGAYAMAMNQGQASLSSIPNAIRNEVVMRNAQMGGINTKLSETAIKQIAETQNALDGLLDLNDKIASNLKYIGPLKGLQKYNPWSKARQIQADVDRIRQKVGKALEGGVLRKEDEEKYKKILATLTDTPETAVYKIEQLISDLQTDYNRYVEAQSSGGRYTGGLQSQSITNNDPMGIL